MGKDFIVSKDALGPFVERLEESHRTFARQYPGESGRRQAVHTVYGGAQLYSARTCGRLGELALCSLQDYAPDATALTQALRGADPAMGTRSAGREIRESADAGGLAQRVYDRIVQKLGTEPVEDFRIDFEDGFGVRPDAEEDHHAQRAARELATAARDSSAPPFSGFRIKPLSAELWRRSLRTCEIFIGTLVQELGELPSGFAVTLPKIVSPIQVRTLVEVLAALERSHGLGAGTLHLELMVETTQSIIGADGRSMLPLLLEASQGRCVAAHFGTYDFTAGCDITAAHQHMEHPTCEFAKHMMKVSFAGTGIQLSDGATNVLPVAPHRAQPGTALTPEQLQANREVVHAAWRLHHQNVRNSLAGGFYQGWDLHPAQLPTRYAAVYGFFVEGLETASERLRNFIDQAAQATLVGDVFDDAATGQGLLNFFLRGVNCGALDEAEAIRTGITLDDLRGRSFVKILENRRNAQA